MKRHINFGSIEQFRTIVQNIKRQAQYIGYDEELKEAKFDASLISPTIEVTFSEKIHGTNAAVCYSRPDGFWVQSRENIITPEKDNAACAFNVEQNKDEWMKIITELAKGYNINLDTHIISVFFEWAGGNIQKKSALTGLDKRAIIFQHFKVSPIDPITNEQGQEVQAQWYETKATRTITSEGMPERRETKTHNVSGINGIFNIMDFPTGTMLIDFERPDIAQNKLIELVDKLEMNSPVGQEFGIEGNIGEGVVCTFTYNGVMHRFKVKGEKHSNSKVKTLKPVDNEKEQLKIDIATKVTPAWRLEQMFDLANDVVNAGIPSIKNMGDFLKRVNLDILKEESDIIAEAGLEPKEVFSKSSVIAKRWYQEQLNKLAGL